MRLSPKEIVIQHPKQPHEHRHVFRQRRGPEMHIHRVHALQEPHEILRANHRHERQANGGIHRIAATNPLPETKHVLGINTKGGYFLRISGHGHEMLSHSLFRPQLLYQPPLSGMRISQRFLRGKSLRRYHKKRGLGITLIQHRNDVGRVHIGHKLGTDTGGGIGAQRPSCHGRPQIRAANTNIHHGLNRVPGIPQPSPRPQRSGEIPHAAQYLMHVGCYILTINH